MSYNLNNVIVFDLETSSTDTKTTQILEIAAIAIDPIRWKPIPGSEFVSLIKPDDESKIEAGALAKNKLKIEDLKKAAPAKIVFSTFVEHVRRYGGKTTSSFTAPFAAGKNIRQFDLPIIQRYCEKFKFVDSDGRQKLFNHRCEIELEDDLFRWFGQTNMVDSISMDTVREWFGISNDGAHRAMIDVRQTAWMICKFQQFYRDLCKQRSFKDSGSEIDFTEPLTDLDFE